jgi:hypothetical protein
MTQAFNLSQFANKLNSSGQTDNTGLQNSSVTVTAGTGMSGGGAVSLGGSTTLTNAGVTSIVAGTGISISGATGAVTVTNSSSAVPTNAQQFTSSGTFTIPTGVTGVKATLIGAGGGGGWTNTPASAGNAGTTTLTSGTQTITTMTCNGGTAGQGNNGGGGGNATGGNFYNYSALDGANGLCCGSYGGGIISTWGTIRPTQYNGGPYPDRGWGAYGYGGNGGGGGGGGFAVSYFTGLTPGATITVTLGAGGNSATGSNFGPGAKGYAIFEW